MIHSSLHPCNFSACTYVQYVFGALIQRMDRSFYSCRFIHYLTILKHGTVMKVDIGVYSARDSGYSCFVGMSVSLSNHVDCLHA